MRVRPSPGANALDHRSAPARRTNFPHRVGLLIIALSCLLVALPALFLINIPFARQGQPDGAFSSPTPGTAAIPTVLTPQTQTPAQTLTLASPLPSPSPVPMEVFAQVSDGKAFWFRSDSRYESLGQFIKAEDCVHSGLLGLPLTYGSTGKDYGGWGVHWAHLFDASNSTALDFWVKGASGGETIQIGLRDTYGIEAKAESKPLVVVSASNWKLVRIPLNQFEGVNIASVENVHFSFDQNHGSSSICKYDIAFVL